MHTMKRVRRAPVAITAFLILALGTSAAAVPAQQAIDLAWQPTCEACRIQLVRVAAIGDSVGPGILSDDAKLAVRNGEIHVRDMITSRGRILVFDTTGRYINSYGRIGEGPGEYQWPISLLWNSRGELRVLDMALRRMTVLDSAMGVMATHGLEAVSALAALADDTSLVISVQVPTRDRIGYPLHLLDGSGSIRRSFGTEVPLAIPTPGASEPLRLAPAEQGKIWAAAVDKLDIVLWDVHTGTAVRRYTGDIAAYGNADLPPAAGPPDVRGLYFDDAEQLLWILVRTPDPDWSEPRRLQIQTGETRTDPRDQHRTSDTVIEVWDVSRGVVVARARSDHLLSMIGSGHVAHYAERPGGEPYFQVARLQIAGFTTRRLP